jgi:hypothetical protein
MRIGLTTKSEGELSNPIETYAGDSSIGPLAARVADRLVAVVMPIRPIE